MRQAVAAARASATVEIPCVAIGNLPCKRSPECSRSSRDGQACTMLDAGQVLVAMLCHNPATSRMPPPRFEIRVAFSWAKANQFVKHTDFGQPPETKGTQASLLATHIGAANRSLNQTFLPTVRRPVICTAFCRMFC